MKRAIIRSLAIGLLAASTAKAQLVNPYAAQMQQRMLMQRQMQMQQQQMQMRQQQMHQQQMHQQQMHQQQMHQQQMHQQQMHQQQMQQQLASQRAAMQPHPAQGMPHNPGHFAQHSGQVSSHPGTGHSYGTTEARRHLDWRGPGWQGGPSTSTSVAVFVAPTTLIAQLQPSPIYAGYFVDPANPGVLYVQGGDSGSPDAAADDSPDASDEDDDAPAGPAGLAGGFTVQIVNPAALGATLIYSINGQAYRLDSGESQTLVVSDGSVVSFDRGQGLGRASYALSDGRYEFASTTGGWDLYHIVASAR